MNQSKVIYLKSGETIDYDKIIEMTKSRLCYISYSLVKDFECAKDITSECLAKFLTKDEGFDNYSAIEHFLKKMVINASIDHVRRKNRWMDYLKANQSTTIEKENLEKYNTPDLIEKIYNQISLLPEKERIVFTLIYLEGYTLEEVAEKLGTAFNTVKNQLSTATIKLRKALGANGYLLLTLLITNGISRN